MAKVKHFNYGLREALRRREINIGDRVRVKDSTACWKYGKSFVEITGVDGGNVANSITRMCSCEDLRKPFDLLVAHRTNENKNNKKKGYIMSVIKNIFKSKESRAVEHFQLGDNSKNLNEKGLMEFVQFLYETDRETRENFLAKLVKAHKQDTESK